MTPLLDDFVDFILHSPTSFHACREMGNRLASLDFTPLEMKEAWELKKGEKYFIHEQGTLIAFHLPKEKPKKMRVIATHTDSPALKLKPHPDQKCKNMITLSAEVYGSPTLHTWINRDLAIAGRVLVEGKKGQLEEHLVHFSDAPVLIPLIAPHLDRDILEKGLQLNKQEHLLSVAALLGSGDGSPYVETLLKRELSYHTLLDFDLFLVPLEEPRRLGMDGEMLASYRIDNLSSAHAALSAIGKLPSASEGILPLALFFDHEEVGSASSTGAHSPLVPNLLKRLGAFYGLSAEEEVRLAAQSTAASVDVAHALNPNYQKKYDPHHEPLLGKGIVLKYNADMRYTTNSRSGGEMVHLCNTLGIPYQKFVNRADNRAGSTVGPILAEQLGLSVVDIGIAQLSMHAAREVISCQDQIDLTTLLTHFLA